MDAPAGLGERGLSLWGSLSNGEPPTDALALEAARLADRLDELDNIIQGKGVLNLMQFRLHLDEIDEDGDRNINVEVKFAAPLAEARQQATALANILAKLSPADSKSSSRPKPADKPAAETPLERMRRLRKA